MRVWPRGGGSASRGALGGDYYPLPQKLLDACFHGRFLERLIDRHRGSCASELGLWCPASVVGPVLEVCGNLAKHASSRVVAALAKRAHWEVSQAPRRCQRGFGLYGGPCWRSS